MTSDMQIRHSCHSSQLNSSSIHTADPTLSVLLNCFAIFVGRFAVFADQKLNMEQKLGLTIFIQARTNRRLESGQSPEVSKALTVPATKYYVQALETVPGHRID